MKSLTSRMRTVLHQIAHPMKMGGKLTPRKFGITNQTIAALEKRGLINYADLNDRHFSVEYKLTEAGEAYADKEWPTWREQFDG